MEKHPFTLPAQQIAALDELKGQIAQRRPPLLAKPWVLLGLGLAVAAVLKTLTRTRR